MNKTKFTEYLKEIIYGGIDGIVTTFAVVAGFTGAQLSESEVAGLSTVTVLLFGVANLFADGLSMGLGNFLSLRASNDIYLSEKIKLSQEIKMNFETKKSETLNILKNNDFNLEDSEVLFEKMSNNHKYWVEWLMINQKGMINSDSVNPIYNGLTTTIAFLIFGSIPLIPFIILNISAINTFYVSAAGAFVAFLLLGFFKWKIVANISLTRSVGEIIFIGSIAAMVAFFVGNLF